MWQGQIQKISTNPVVSRPLSPDSPDGTAFQREALGRHSILRETEILSKTSTCRMKTLILLFSGLFLLIRLTVRHSKERALGRRSMSEKRKGHADPKSSEFYQRIKENREKGRQYYSGESDLFVCLSVCAFSVSSGCPSFWSGCLFEWGWLVWFGSSYEEQALDTCLRWL